MSHIVTVYRIRVREHLSDYWQGYFGGLSLSETKGADGVSSELRGALDEPALYAVLGKLRDLNLHVVSVAALGAATSNLEG